MPCLASLITMFMLEQGAWAIGPDIIFVIYSQESFFVTNYMRVFLFSQVSPSKAGSQR